MSDLGLDKNDEIMQIYLKTYKLDNSSECVADYLIWIIENKCYLIDIFMLTINKYFKTDIFSIMYILDHMHFLYNNHIVKHYYNVSKLDVNINYRSYYLNKYIQRKYKFDRNPLQPEDRIIFN